MGDRAETTLLRLKIKELEREVSQLRAKVGRYDQAIPILIGEDPLTADLSEISHETLITTMVFND